MQQMAFLQVEQPTEYHPKVRDLPAGERPMNRLREVGPTSISTTELLACLLQTPDALHQAQRLLVQFGGLPGLVSAADAEIVQINGIGPAQAARIKAALEFGRRLMLTAPEDRYVVRSPGDVGPTAHGGDVAPGAGALQGATARYTETDS